jgi:hypothetical protein
MLIELIFATSIASQGEVCFRNQTAAPVTVIVDAIIPWGDTGGPRDILYLEPQVERCLVVDVYFFGVLPGDETLGERPIAWPQVHPNCGNTSGLAAVVDITGTRGNYQCSVVEGEQATR